MNILFRLVTDIHVIKGSRNPWFFIPALLRVETCLPHSGSKYKFVIVSAFVFSVI